MGFIHDRLVAAGHRVDYFCAEDVPRGMNGRLSRFTFPMLVRRHAVRAARSGEPYDIINIHEPSSAAVSLSRSAAGNPKIVVTSHGVERRGWQLALEELRLGREGPSLKTRLTAPLTILWQAKLGLRRADHIFCLNFEDRDYLMRWLKLSGEKITRIYPGASQSYAAVAESRSYDKVGQLLFAGTWLSRKGIKEVVAAFTTLAATHQDLKLCVLGAGMPDELVLDYFPTDIRERVSCIRSRNDDETAAVLARSDIYLLPSLFEGTPLTLIEAMMSGMPVVTTETCGMKDVIQHNGNGLLVPVRSPETIVAAIESLMEERALRARLGRQAHLDALENYTWEHVALSVQKAYERLVEIDNYRK